MYAFALRNTTVNHIRGCVVKILYPTPPRFQSKMAIVWDRSITSAGRMGGGGLFEFARRAVLEVVW